MQEKTLFRAFFLESYPKSSEACGPRGRQGFRTRRKGLVKKVSSQSPFSLFRYLKPYRVQCVVGPLFKLAEAVLELARLLTVYCGRMIVHIIPFTEIQEEIRRACPEEYFTLIMRRFMMRIAEDIAAHNECKAIVTGENLGQVASQTMEAMACTQDVTHLPVLQPLIGMDKRDIVKIAREIGTFDTSILPYEDCCTVFTPRHPKTRPTVAEVAEAESALDVDALVREAVDEGNGDVVVIEKERKLTYDIPYQARLIEAGSYDIGSYEFIKGFICGLHSGNYDITHVFVDNFYKIVSNKDPVMFGEFLDWLESFSERENIEFVISVTIDPDTVGEAIRKYMI